MMFCFVDYDFLMSNRVDDLQTGIDIMSAIIDKPINFSITHKKDSGFKNLNNVEIYNIKGVHPSGNESFQINKIEIYSTLGKRVFISGQNASQWSADVDTIFVNSLNWFLE